MDISPENYNTLVPHLQARCVAVRAVFSGKTVDAAAGL